MHAPRFGITAEKWLLIYYDISYMIINRRLRIGIKNARWYIGTTGGNNEVFASFIRFTSRLCSGLHGTALEYVLVCINGQVYHFGIR